MITHRGLLCVHALIPLLNMAAPAAIGGRIDVAPISAMIAAARPAAV